MKIQTQLIVLWVTFFLIGWLSGEAAAADPTHDFSLDGLDPAQQHCYKMGVVGYDSVVNAKLGVPVEEVKETMTYNGEMSGVLMYVVLEAYNWTGSPHAYALRSYDACKEILENNPVVEM